MPVRPLTKESALMKMAALCARSEQCTSDIMRKLRAKGLSVADAGWVVDELTDRKFIDDGRFARSFTNDKIRFNSWGRNKIRMALVAKRIGDMEIRAALDEIDVDEYNAAAERVASGKATALDLNIREDQMKFCRHILSHGFESDIAIRLLRQMKSRDKNCRNT